MPPHRPRRPASWPVYAACLAAVCVAASGVWLATRPPAQKAGDGAPADRPQPAPKVAKAGPPKPGPPRTPTGGEPGTPKAEKKPPTLGECFALAEKEGERLRKAAEEELPAVRRLLTADEWDVVDRILRRKNDRRDNFTDGEIQFMRDHKMAKWVWGHSVKWALADEQFRTTAGWVWNRSPKMRSPDEVIDLAAKWGEMDDSLASAVFDAMAGAENKRELTKDQRNLVVDFAGEEYYANRP